MGMRVNLASLASAPVLGLAAVLAGQPILGPSLFSAIVLVVLVTTLLAPAGLRAVFARARSAPVPNP